MCFNCINERRDLSRENKQEISRIKKDTKNLREEGDKVKKAVSETLITVVNLQNDNENNKHRLVELEQEQGIIQKRLSDEEYQSQLLKLSDKEKDVQINKVQGVISKLDTEYEKKKAHRRRIYAYLIFNK